VPLELVKLLSVRVEVSEPYVLLITMMVRALSELRTAP
jgi:hypothetical protein